MMLGQETKSGSCRHSSFPVVALLIDPAEFLAKLTELEDAGGFKDGSKIHDVFTAYSDVPLWSNWSRSWLTEHDFDDRSVWPSLTVAQVFRQRSGLNALSLPYGPGILFRNKGAVNAATLAHEVFHQFPERDDPTIQRDWGLPVDPDNTKNISDEFEERCL